MDATSARLHQGAVARVVYVAQYRLDIDVIACQFSKTMANPRVRDETLMKKEFRYLSGHPQLLSVPEQGGRAVLAIRQ